ncbi:MULTISPECIES: hypothetical protein [unclassified Curtobacterium]|nr:MULTISPECIES: hypothetical protein [unclassified Curtobacterium]WIB71289.1 hypothetical protein DEI85_02455 [Curtobacterium sp. MCBD17_026]
MPYAAQAAHLPDPAQAAHLPDPAQSAHVPPGRAAGLADLVVSRHR